MKGLTNSQLLQYSNATSTYQRIQAFNLLIRNKRIAGNKGVSYYVFANATEQTLYRQGQFLLVQNDPINAASYAEVVKI